MRRSAGRVADPSCATVPAPAEARLRHNAAFKAKALAVNVADLKKKFEAGAALAHAVRNAFACDRIVLTVGAATRRAARPGKREGRRTSAGSHVHNLLTTAPLRKHKI